MPSTFTSTRTHLNWLIVIIFNHTLLPVTEYKNMSFFQSGLRNVFLEVGWDGAGNIFRAGLENLKKTLGGWPCPYLPPPKSS